MIKFSHQHLHPSSYLQVRSKRRQSYLAMQYRWSYDLTAILNWIFSLCPYCSTHLTLFFTAAILWSVRFAAEIEDCSASRNSQLLCAILTIGAKRNYVVPWSGSHSSKRSRVILDLALALSSSCSRSLKVIYCWIIVARVYFGLIVSMTFFPFVG